MAQPVLCKVCGKRRARRACPAVMGDICTLCCGTEREVSLSCPLECEWLQEAHQHEKPIPPAENQISNSDIAVNEDFLADHEELLLFCIHSLIEAALRTPGAVDTDVMAALEAMIQTHRTLLSGLVYETRAANSIAAGVQRSFSAALESYDKVQAERGEFSSRPGDVLTILVFLHHFGLQNQNGRPRGRMFLDVLRRLAPAPGVEERAPSIIL